MSTAKPVVSYGVSGYTGRLVAECPREYNLPFIAAGPDAERIQEALNHLPGIEAAGDADRSLAPQVTGYVD